jgi:WD40 repeat protein
MNSHLRVIAKLIVVSIAFLGGTEMYAQTCEAQQATVPSEARTQDVKRAIAVDSLGDPLPEGGLARIGTARLRGQVLTFSADGKTFVTAGADRALHYWDAIDGKERNRKQLSFAVDPGRFNFALKMIGVSADGQTFVSADVERIRVLETATGKELHSLPNPASPASGKSLSRLAISNDGKSIAASLFDASVQKCPLQFWNTATGKNYQLVFDAKDFAYPSFSPDGSTLIVAGQKGAIRIYETTTGKEVRQIVGQPLTGNPLCPVISPDSKTLAWLDGDQRIKLWTIADGTEGETFDIADAGRNHHLAFTADGKRLALATEKVVLIWDAVAGREVQRISRQGPHSFIGAQEGALAFSPDGKTLAVSNPAGAHLYDVASGKLRFEPMGYAGMGRLAFSPDGAMLASSTSPDHLHIWDSGTGKPLLRVDCPNHTDPVLFSPDGKHFVTGDRTGIVHVFDAKSGDLRRRLDINGDNDAKVKYTIVRLAMDRTSITALGNRFEAKLQSRHTVWDLATGNVKQTTDFAGAFNEMFGPNGATFHMVGELVIHDAVAGKPLAKLNDRGGYFFSFSSGGEKLAVASLEAVTVLELPAGRRLVTVPTGKLGDVELSPDGKYLASIHREELVVWEIATAKPVHRVRSPAPYSVAERAPFAIRTAFAPDGRRLATVHLDTTILIWDIAPGFRRGLNAAKTFGQKDLERLWSDLASDDAVKAYRAIWTLAGAPDEAVPFARDRLKPASDKRKRIAQLLVELDSDELAVRNAAFEALASMDIEIRPAFDRAIAAGVSLECRRRMEKLLDRPPAIIHDADILRGARAIVMLEAAGTPAARDLLKLLTSGDPDARLTQHARESLQRIK